MTNFLRTGPGPSQADRTQRDLQAASGGPHAPREQRALCHLETSRGAGAGDDRRSCCVLEHGLTFNWFRGLNLEEFARNMSEYDVGMWCMK